MRIDAIVVEGHLGTADEAETDETEADKAAKAQSAQESCAVLRGLADKVIHADRLCKACKTIAKFRERTCRSRKFGSGVCLFGERGHRC